MTILILIALGLYFASQNSGTPNPTTNSGQPPIVAGPVTQASAPSGSGNPPLPTPPIFVPTLQQGQAVCEIAGGCNTPKMIGTTILVPPNLTDNANPLDGGSLESGPVTIGYGNGPSFTVLNSNSGSSYGSNPGGSGGGGSSTGVTDPATGAPVPTGLSGGSSGPGLAT